MELNENTRLEDLISAYPDLKTQMADINPRFRMLQTPMGKRMIRKATIAEMSERSGMPVEDLVSAIEEKIGVSGAAGETAKMSGGAAEVAAEPTPATATDPAPATDSEAAAEPEPASAAADEPATEPAPQSESEPKPTWWDQTPSFKTMDVRGAKGNFFPGIKRLAQQTAVGSGIEIIQTFEPLPLYDVMEELGYERETVKAADNEYHAYFYRVQAREESGDIAFRPIALLNFPTIDEELGDIAVNLWNLTWNDQNRYLDQETRLLLSMANALGAGRMRQATRELIKAYAHGIDSRAFDDVFELVAWNQGIGTFASEVGPSTLFRAYSFIKDQEKRGVDRQEIKERLLEQFGEKNPDVGVKQPPLAGTHETRAPVNDRGPSRNKRQVSR